MHGMQGERSEVRAKNEIGIERAVAGCSASNWARALGSLGASPHLGEPRLKCRRHRPRHHAATEPGLRSGSPS